MDYTVTCEQAVRFDVRLDAGQVSIDGDADRAGAFTKDVRIYPGEATTIDSVAGTQTVRCRPRDLPFPRVAGQGSARAYLVGIQKFPVGSGYQMVLDKHGTPIWWITGNRRGVFLDLGPSRNTLISSINQSGSYSQNGVFDLLNPDGSSLAAWGLEGNPGLGADFHDFVKTPDSRWLIAYKPRAERVDLSAFRRWCGPQRPTSAKVLDAYIQKVDGSGQVAWEWNSKDHVPLSDAKRFLQLFWTEPQIPGFTPPSCGDWPADVVNNWNYDIPHINSIEPVDDGVIFSARHLDAIYKIGYPSGNLEWKLGPLGPPSPSPGTGDDCFDVATNDICTNLRVSASTDTFYMYPFAGQHDARILGDGTLTALDNGTSAGRPPRAVRYRLSPANSKADLIQEIQDPTVPTSSCCGSARVMENGNWVINWGGFLQSSGRG